MGEIRLPLTKRFMRLFFRLLYHPMAWTYDLVADTVSLGRWKNWVLAAASLTTGPRVLELGYGPGHLQAQLHKSQLAPIGLDESFQMARQAKHRLRKLGFQPRLLRGMAQTLPFAGRSFDGVTATFPTLYIVDPQTLSEIARVLRPGGRLVVLVGAWITGRSFPERVMSRLFEITGQSPPESKEITDFVEPYQQAGFQARIRFVEQPRSRLLFVIATRRA